VYKKDKETNNDLQDTNIKLQNEQNELPINLEWTNVLLKGKQYSLIWWHRSVILAKLDYKSGIKDMIGLCLLQTENILGHLWHRYPVAVNKVVVATVK